MPKEVAALAKNTSATVTQAATPEFYSKILEILEETKRNFIYLEYYPEQLLNSKKIFMSDAILSIKEKAEFAYNMQLFYGTKEYEKMANYVKRSAKLIQHFAPRINQLIVEGKIEESVLSMKSRALARIENYTYKNINNIQEISNLEQLKNYCDNKVVEFRLLNEEMVTLARQHLHPHIDYDDIKQREELNGMWNDYRREMENNPAKQETAKKEPDYTGAVSEKAFEHLPQPFFSDIEASPFSVPDKHKR